MTGFEFGPSVATRLSTSRVRGAVYFDFTNVLNHSAAASTRPHGLNRGIGSHEQAKHRALSSCGHIFGRKETKRSMMRFAKIEKIAARVAVGALALVSLLSMTAKTRAQEAERPYPKMLPLSQYLMDRNAAIALARSAAPEGISKDASVLVLTPKGWETAVQGTNGFVCMAGPSWTASIDFYEVRRPQQRAGRWRHSAAVR